MTYIIEIGYLRQYEKSKNDHIQMLRDYSYPEQFKNSWIDQIKGVAKFGVSFFVGSMVGASTHVYNMENLILEKQKLANNENIEKSIMQKLKDMSKKYFRKNNKESEKSNKFLIKYNNPVANMIGASVLTYMALPVVQPTKTSLGILFIPSRKLENFHSINMKNTLVSDDQIKMNIKGEEFNPLLVSIAQSYNGTLFDTKSEANANILYISFDCRKGVVGDVKRFLYSLPPNVFIRYIYRIDPLENNSNSNNSKKYNTIKNNGKLNRYIIYPRSQSDLEDVDLDSIDKSLIKYFDTHTKIYNKYNENVKYIVDKIKPLRFFLPLLPSSMHPPKWSPMK